MPIPQRLALSLAAHVERYPAETVLPGEAREQVGPWALERAVRNPGPPWTAWRTASGTTETYGTISRRS